MKYTDSITNTYKQHNEDACGVSDNCAWVMDGALPLSNTKVTNAPSDVIWMVNWWTDYLNNTLQNTSSSIADILTTGIHSFNTEFKQFADPVTLSKLDRASAAIGILRVHEDTVECYVLGDIEVALRFKDETYTVVTDTSLATLDSEVINMISNNPDRQKQIVFNGYTQAELDLLQRNRMTMNSPSGYAILEHETSAIPKGVYTSFPRESVHSVLLMSDGYSALYNKFDHCTLPELLNEVGEKSTDGLIPTLRQIELSGLDTKKRLRKHDDATAVYVEID